MIDWEVSSKCQSCTSCLLMAFSYYFQHMLSGWPPYLIITTHFFRLLARNYVHDVITEFFECSYAFPNECSNVVIPHSFMPWLYGVCVCVPVLAEVERLVQKCDRSAANRSGMRKVEDLVPYVDILVKMASFWQQSAISPKKTHLLHTHHTVYSV